MCDADGEPGDVGVMCDYTSKVARSALRRYYTLQGVIRVGPQLSNSWKIS